MIRRSVGLLALAACGGGGDDGSALFEAPPTEVVAVTVELREALPAFKVDGRLELSLERLPPFAGAVELSDLVLPAGSRSVTVEVALPATSGRLRARERTFNARAPFLCGSALVDARTDAAVRVALDLCLP